MLLKGGVATPSTSPLDPPLQSDRFSQSKTKKECTMFSYTKLAFQVIQSDIKFYFIVSV